MTVFISAVALNASGSLNPGPLAITVPADAQGVLVFTRAFNNPNLSITSSFTGAFAVSQDTGTERTAVAWAPVTATGAQTISPTWTVIPSEGPLFVVAFVKGIDTSSFATWVRGVDVRADDAVGSAFGLSVASAAADLVLAFDSRYSATQTPPADEAGWTSRFTQGFSGNGGRLRSANSPGSATTTANTQGDQYRGLGLVSIMGSPGGAAGDLAAAGAAQAAGTATLSKTSVLSAAGAAQAAGSAALALAVQLAAAGTAQASGTAALLKGVSLASAGLAVASGSAAMSHGVPLAATGVAVAQAGASLALAVTLGAQGVAQAAGSAVLSLLVNLSAAALAQALGSAALQTGGATDLAAAGSAQASGGATLWLDVPLGAAALAQAQAGGSLALVVPLSAAALAQAGGAAALAGVVQLSAGGQAVASGGAALQVMGPVLSFSSGMVARNERRHWVARNDNRTWRAAA